MALVHAYLGFKRNYMYTSKGLHKSTHAKVNFTPTEKRFVEIRARDAGLKVATYIRQIALKDFPRKDKTLPSEVLAFNGQLSGIAGTLDIIARKRLDNEDLDGLLRAELVFRAKEIKLLIKDIKSYLQ